MTDSLAEIVLGLQRMAEHARLRGDDLRHIQQQENKEHAAWLSHQIAMVDEVRRVLEEEKNKFSAYFPMMQQERREALPKAVIKGPTAVGGNDGR